MEKSGANSGGLDYHIDSGKPIPFQWDAESIHNAIYEGSRSRGIGPKNTFKAFYRILLGRDRGPRLGFFLSTMERADILRKLDIALKDA